MFEKDHFFGEIKKRRTVEEPPGLSLLFHPLGLPDRVLLPLANVHSFFVSAIWAIGHTGEGPDLFCSEDFLHLVAAISQHF